MTALDCDGNDPFVDVFSLNDLSFPSLVQEYIIFRVFERIHLRPYVSLLFTAWAVQLVQCFEKCAATYGRNIHFSKKMTFQIQKITKQDK